MLIVLFASFGTSHAAPDDPQPESRVIQAVDKDQYEITSTDQGATYAQDAVDRWAKEHGIHTPVSDVKVYNMGIATSPNIVIMPSSLPFKEVAVVVNPNGTIRTAVQLETTMDQYPSSAPDPQYGDIAVQQERETYTLVSGMCLDTIVAANGTMTYCYKIYKVVNEIDSTKDYFLIDYVGNATPTNSRQLVRARIEASQSIESPPLVVPDMTLVDWNPKTAINGNCDQVDLGISMGGASMSVPRKVCENWVPTQFSGVHIAVEWTPNFLTPVFTAREVALTELISVDQGKSPTWFLWAEFEA
jgi:hypothetical protein